jgi:SAM-dependent methyltransferase
MTSQGEQLPSPPSDETGGRYSYDQSYQFLKNSIAKSQSPTQKAKDALRAFRDIYFALKLRPGDSVLDVGCNIGTEGHYLQMAGIRAFGVDVNFAALKIGGEIYGRDKRNWRVQAMANNLPFADASIDYVVSQDIFEHFEGEAEARRVFQEMVRVCKGRRMAHKITVLEDREWIDADPSHRIKKPTRWWAGFFRSQGWRVVRNPVQERISIISGLRKRTLRHGFFLIEES